MDNECLEIRLKGMSEHLDEISNGAFLAVSINRTILLVNVIIASAVIVHAWYH